VSALLGGMDRRTFQARARRMRLGSSTIRWVLLSSVIAGGAIPPLLAAEEFDETLALMAYVPKLEKVSQASSIQGAQPRMDTEELFLRLDEQGRRAAFLARRALSLYGGRELEPEHLLIGIVQAAPERLKRFARRDWMPELTQKRLTDGMSSQTARIGEGVSVPIGTRFVAVIVGAAAKAGSESPILVEHLLLGLLDDKGGAGDELRQAGVERIGIESFLQPPN
jgi:hypothetical protein